ncbi:MAG: hypothetical protein KDB28_08820 [Tetrasphaera sp.]|nr:hypothetical protein [Tetrasphaera sp.]
MFETILGLPLHPLVVHAVVVLGPLAALLLVAYAAVPRWRVGLRIPVLGLALIAAGSAFVADQAGEALMTVRGEPGFDHAEKGELAFISLLVLFLATIAVTVMAKPLPAATNIVLPLVIAVAAAGFALFAVTQAGHSGAQSVWQGTFSLGVIGR